MELINKVRITSNLTFLCENTVDLDMLLIYLASKFVLSTHELQIIKSKPTDVTKCEEMYNLVLTRPCFEVLLECLRVTRNGHLIDRLTSHSDLDDNKVILYNLSIDRNAVKFDVDDPVESFTGRKKELERLHEFLTQKPRKLTCLYGLGGVGKTELAKKYASCHKLAFDGNIFWINAETRSDLRASFSRLCERLSLPFVTETGGVKDDKHLAETVYFHLMKRSCLYIFDNAEYYQNRAEPDRACRNFLPSPLSMYDSFSFLFTTRNAKFHESANFIEVTCFELSDSREFLERTLTISEKNAEDLDKLHNYLQGLPLALEQAISFINVKDEEIKDLGEAEGFSISDYMKIYDSSEAVSVLDFNIPENKDNTYTKTIMTTWKLSMNNIRTDSEKNPQSSLALLIMSICAYFAPDNIDVALFEPLVHYDKMKLAPVLQIPKKYSLYKYGHGKIDIHRLVQKVIRLSLQSENAEEATLNSVLNLILDPLFKGIFSPRNYIHSISVWNHATSYLNLVKNFSNLPWLIAQLTIHGSNYEMAYEFCKEAVPLLKRVLDVEESNVVLTYTSNTTMTTFMMGRALHKLGKYDEALKTFLEVYDIHINSAFIGVEHADALRTRYHIAGVLQSQGKYDDALTESTHIWNLQRTKLKANDRDIWEIQCQVAIILQLKGHFDKALEVYQDLYDAQLASIGEFHLDTLTTKSNMSVIFSEQGKFEEAFQNYRDIYNAREKSQGINHVETLTAAYNVAHTLGKMGMYTQALEYYETIIEKQKKLLADDHPFVLKTHHGKGMVLIEMENYLEAREVFSHVSKKREEILGECHPETLQSKINHAITLKRTLCFDDARNIYEDILPICEKVLGNEHFDTLRAKLNQGILLMELGHLEEALAIIDHTCEVRAKLFGKSDPSTLKSLENKALCLQYQKQYYRSFQVYQQILPQLITLYGNVHFETLNTKVNMANLLDEQGKLNEAEILYKDVFAVLKSKVEIDHPFLQRAILNLTIHYEENRNYSQMKSLFDELIVSYQETLEPNHLLIIELKANFAIILVRFRKYQQAIQLCDEIINRTSILPQNDLQSPLLINSICTKANALRKLGKYEESLKEMELALSMYDTFNQKDERVYLSLRHNKINVFKSQKMYIQALILYKHIYKRQCLILGREHVESLITLSSIANIFRLQGFYRASMIIDVYLVNIREKQQGELHPDTLRALMNLANVVGESGQFYLSLRLYRKVRLHLERCFEPEHPYIVLTEMNYKHTVKNAQNWTLKVMNILIFVFKLYYSFGK